MEYQSVTARFLFNNGINRYTVEYAYGLSMWFIFNDEEKTDCVYKTKNKLKTNFINKSAAENILYEFLQS